MTDEKPAVEEVVALPPEGKKWTEFITQLSRMGPWMKALGVIDIISGAIALPWGAGTLFLGILLLMAESKLNAYLKHGADSLGEFASDLRTYFFSAVIIFIVLAALYFLFLLFYALFVVAIALMMFFTIMAEGGSSTPI